MAERELKFGHIHLCLYRWRAHEWREWFTILMDILTRILEVSIISSLSWHKHEQNWCLFLIIDQTNWPSFRLETVTFHNAESMDIITKYVLHTQTITNTASNQWPTEYHRHPLDWVWDQVLRKSEHLLPRMRHPLWYPLWHIWEAKHVQIVGIISAIPVHVLYLINQGHRYQVWQPTVASFLFTIVI